MPEIAYPDSVKRGAFFQTALREVSSLGGVTGAAVTSNLPASNVDNEKTLFTIQGRAALQANEVPAADFQTISGDYFSLLKIPLIAGRFFTEADNATGARVAIISRTMANRFWPARDPLGQRLKLGAADSAEPWLTVVGIVGDARQNWWNPATFPVLYLPYLQSSRSSFRFVFRVASNPTSYALAARSAIAQVDPEIPVTELKTLKTEVQDSIAIVHIMGILMAIFAVVALLLSSIGVYGILAENVAQRTHDFGIRFALGANPRDGSICFWNCFGEFADLGAACRTSHRCRTSRRVFSGAPRTSRRSHGGAEVRVTVGVFFFSGNCPSAWLVPGSNSTRRSRRLPGLERFGLATVCNADRKVTVIHSREVAETDFHAGTFAIPGLRARPIRPRAAQAWRAHQAPRPAFCGAACSS